MKTRLLFIISPAHPQTTSLWVIRHLISWQPLFCWSPPDCLSKLPVAMSHSCCLPANSFSDLINSFCDCIYYAENWHSHRGGAHLLLSKLLSGPENQKNYLLPGFYIKQREGTLTCTNQVANLQFGLLRGNSFEWSYIRVQWSSTLNGSNPNIEENIEPPGLCNFLCCFFRNVTERKKCFWATVHHVMLQLEHMFQTVGE